MRAHPARTVDDLMSALPGLAAEARDRATEFEAARNIAPDFVTRLKTAGAYRVLVAREQGGPGGSLADWLVMATTLAEADTSTGWARATARSAARLSPTSPSPPSWRSCCPTR